ncbi:thermosome subunit [Candidatus Woesearchaeota archaeon]|nr:thermosome subunit [Candidatus Woesearchaeota archaeon]MBT5924780.1 thermosome subunit [Candidatus Woesearchaeota archaeon]
MDSNVQPIFIMPDDTKRTTGKDAQSNNIAAAKAVAQTVRTTLGPKGMDKMLVDAEGSVVVTNDGVTILREMHIDHPAAKMVVEIAKTQEDAVGDGTTTAVVLAGELLKKAEDLLDQNIHPTVLARGYRVAEKEAQKLVRNFAEPVLFDNDPLLRNIAITAMTGKGAEANKERLADIVVQAVKKVSTLENGKVIITKDAIKVETHIGERSDASTLVEGIVISKERAHPSMPTYINDAKVALLDSSLEIKNTDIDAKIQITDPSQLNAFLEQEERLLQDMVQKVVRSGATVVLCQKGIDDLAQHFLAKAGILAVRRVRKSDMETVSLASGALIVNNLKELSSDDLGFAGIVRETKVGDEDMIFVEQCKNPRAVTLLVKGGTEHVAGEISRAVTDAIGDVVASLMDGFVVAGAGSIEIEVARGLRQFAQTCIGREQLAVHAFADALEIIPRTLAENAGLDPIDIIAHLRSDHDMGKKWSGVNVLNGGVFDAWNSGVVEPLKIKTQAFHSAAEVAEMILRIDDVILSGQGSDMPSNVPQDF